MVRPFLGILVQSIPSVSITWGFLRLVGPFLPSQVLNIYSFTNRVVLTTCSALYLPPERAQNPTNLEKRKKKKKKNSPQVLPSLLVAPVVRLRLHRTTSCPSSLPSPLGPLFFIPSFFSYFFPLPFFARATPTLSLMLSPSSDTNTSAGYASTI